MTKNKYNRKLMKEDIVDEIKDIFIFYNHKKVKIKTIYIPNEKSVNIYVTTNDKK